MILKFIKMQWEKMFLNVFARLRPRALFEGVSCTIMCKQLIPLKTIDITLNKAHKQSTS